MGKAAPFLFRKESLGVFVRVTFRVVGGAEIIALAPG